MLHSRKTSVYRFNHELPPHLPLAVRSVGEYALVQDSQVEMPMQKWFAEIFWSEEGHGEFHLEKQRIKIGNNEVFFLLPGEIHDIRPLTSCWKYHWFTLDHPQSPQWLEAMGFINRPLPAAHCPVDAFRALQKAVGEGTLAGDRHAAHLAHGLLLAAMEVSLSPLAKVHPSWIEQCRQQIDENFQDPELNISQLAEMMKVHRATLFRGFLAAYGMTPSRYLQNRRLHQAIELLKQTDVPIKEVANQVGMADANYLARLLRKISGVSPLRFRAGYRRGRIAHS